ncbi:MULTISPECIES: cytochrome c oxidase subunit II [unclassified Sphingomonas]|uniref:cytochrome c oxidase subunit II n=1 Tax=unclassified Sphingomonas TaxID=196159 RepID=UPI0006F750CA|nr:MULTISPECIES: cytochrome c oxidase subunit II [unclassified Sphingomonas]KQX17771.1 cytochrome C oxidase subunit II [Sphingomonas sp. Root1294]KQY70697.1 cytochrome C oxidase subunit II [Sphingomonas sp. Root50]KRB91809.1 cytochrome C oxidase subunit II [Sphingomonas sp. Root720]
MKTLKTIMMALSLAAIPVAVQAQDAAPAPAASAAAAPAAEAVPAAPAFQHRAPDVDIGQPIPGGFKIQPQVTEIGEDAQWLHNSLLMPIITIICIFVLILLAYAMIRFRAKANPVPSKTSHNTLIEIVWTLVPVLILLVIAVPSIRLLAHQYAQPKPDLTIKVIGNQWYWTYQYPDNGDFELVSNMLPEAEAKKRGEPRLLGVDERVVVPVDAVVKVIVTSNDVIHSWAVPAFWTKMDAVPGRLNETWFKAEREGLYYGQCSELCGARHGFMPIAVEVVSKDKFAEWVHSKGGKMPGEAAPAAAAPAPAAATPAPATDAAVPGTAAPAAPVTSQPATAQN